jgi:hypothetical protein
MNGESLRVESRGVLAEAALLLAWAIGIVAALLLGACAYEIGYRAEYVPPEAPSYVAQGKLLIVMPEEQREFVYEGPPSSSTGDFTTLTVPIGSMVQDIATQVFDQCFAYGVEFVDDTADRDDYVLALEGDLQDFVYSYTKIIDEGFDERDTETWIVPEVDISFAVKAHNRSGSTVLDKVYDSGIVAGESYMVTAKPAERINRTLHATLHALMLQLAADVRPLLIDECELTDVAAGG